MAEVREIGGGAGDRRRCGRFARGGRTSVWAKSPETPKSAILMLPAVSTSMLEGLMSRWMRCSCHREGVGGPCEAGAVRAVWRQRVGGIREIREIREIRQIREIREVLVCRLG